MSRHNIDSDSPLVWFLKRHAPFSVSDDCEDDVVIWTRTGEWFCNLDDGDAAHAIVIELNQIAKL